MLKSIFFAIRKQNLLFCGRIIGFIWQSEGLFNGKVYDCFCALWLAVL